MFCKEKFNIQWSVINCHWPKVVRINAMMQWAGNDLCIVIWFSVVINDHLTTQPNRERQNGQWQDWMQAAKCFSFIPCNALHLHLQPSPHMQLGILHKQNGIGRTAQIMSLHTAQLHIFSACYNI